MTAHGAIFAPVGPVARRALLGVTIGAVLLAALAQVWLQSQPVFPVDDAYITLHNAESLLDGRDRNFPGQSPFAGATSSVHLVVVATLGFLMPTSWALWLSNWLAVGVLLAGVLRLLAAAGASLIVSAAAVVAAWSAADNSYQLINGLETGLAEAVLVWCFVLAFDGDRARAWALPVLAAQLPFLRPELAPLGLLLIAERAWADGLSWRSTRRFARDLCFFGAGALPWLLVGFLASGSIVPSTISVKRHYFAEGCKPTAWKQSVTSGQLRAFVESAGLLAVGIPMLLLRRAGWLLWGFAALFIGAYYVSFPGALGHFDRRYLHVFVPILLLGWVFALMHRASSVRRLAGAGLLASAAWSLLALPAALGRYQTHLDEDTEEAREVAAFVRANIPADARLLVHDIGYVSTAVPHQLVDLVGLKSPRAADLHRLATWPTCGRMRIPVVQELALESNIDYLVMLDDWERIYRLAAGLRLLGWRMEALRAGDVSYQVFRITPPAEPRRLVLGGS